MIHAELSPQLQKGSEIFDDIRHPFGESDFVQPMVSWRLTSRFDIVDAGAKAASKAIGGKAAAAIAQVTDQIF